MKLTELERQHIIDLRDNSKRRKEYERQRAIQHEKWLDSRVCGFCTKTHRQGGRTAGHLSLTKEIFSMGMESPEAEAVYSRRVCSKCMDGVAKLLKDLK